VARCCRIVKTADSQEDALSVPCLGSDFCSPQTSSRGEGVLRKERNRFGVTRLFANHREITLVSVDDFRELVADARKERFGAKAGLGRYGETALTWMLTSR
jgi:hypothetical protein